MVGAVNIYSLSIDNSEAVEMSADNKTRAIPDQQSLKNATERIWCSDDGKLHQEVVGKLFQDGSSQDITYNLEYGLAGDSLSRGVQIFVGGAGLPYQTSGDQTCNAIP